MANIVVTITVQNVTPLNHVILPTISRLSFGFYTNLVKTGIRWEA